MWGRDILLAIRDFKIFAHGQLLDSRRYAVEVDTIQVIRILRGKRDVRQIFETQ